jgi:hypothetical protein
LTGFGFSERLDPATAGPTAAAGLIFAFFDGVDSFASFDPAFFSLPFSPLSAAAASVDSASASSSSLFGTSATVPHLHVRGHSCARSESPQVVHGLS